MRKRPKLALPVFSLFAREAGKHGFERVAVALVLGKSNATLNVGQMFVHQPQGGRQVVAAKRRDDGEMFIGARAVRG